MQPFDASDSAKNASRLNKIFNTSSMALALICAGRSNCFSNASRFAGAFRKQFGCNPGEYNSLKQQKQKKDFAECLL